MSTGSMAAPQPMVRIESANDQFKRSFSSWFWGAMVIATVAHFGVFVYNPAMNATGDYGASTSEMVMDYIPPEVVIPPAPQEIARPARPVISTADIPDNITITPTTLENNPISDLPPPVLASSKDALADFVPFTPSMVQPELKNAREMETLLARHYPPFLRDAKIGGTVHVNFWIDETGKVIKHEIHTSSGYEALDQAAVRVADALNFSPAMNRDQPVRVLVTIPITFKTN